jgi:hypothetical protein
MREASTTKIDRHDGAKMISSTLGLLRLCRENFSLAGTLTALYAVLPGRGTLLYSPSLSVELSLKSPERNAQWNKPKKPSLTYPR